MTRTGFELKRLGDIAPGQGEDLAVTLSSVAGLRESQFRGTETASVANWGASIAQLYELAADAYNAASAASIGHNRANRYMVEANRLRGKAVAILVEAQQQREEHNAKKMLYAFMAGYDASQPRSRFSFDDRDAFLVGEYFKRHDKDLPARVTSSFSKENGYVIHAGGVTYKAVQDLDSHHWRVEILTFLS